MGPGWSARNLVPALFVPLVALLTATLGSASPVEAASNQPAQSSPGQNASPASSATSDAGSPETMGSAPRSGAAAALGRRVTLGTAESARLKERRAGAQPAGLLPLVYHGGQVENTPQVYLSLWGSDWNSAAYQSTISYLQGFFGNVGGSSWLGVTSQYCSGRIPPPSTACQGDLFSRISNPAGQLKATWVDNHDVSYVTPASACGGSFAGDCDVVAAAQRAASHFGPLPRGAVVMVFTPSGRSQPGFVASGWCAYHWSTSSGVAFGYIPYMPDAGRSCGRNSVNSGGTFDGFSIVGGHEYAEAITDPYPDSGWLDSSGAENGDKCAWVGLANVTLGGRPYAVQPTWSNADMGCQIGLASQQGGPPPVPQIPPPARFSWLGGTLTSAPAATSWGAGRLDVVARDKSNGLVHHAFSGGGWGGWDTAGGVLTSEPAAVSWGPNRLDVFVRGTDNALWHTFSDGTRWFGWDSLGGVLTAGPTAASWGPGRLDVFVTGTDGAVWHKWYSGGWSGWESQGGTTNSSPAAVSTGSGVVDVFTQGSDKALRHKAYDGFSWSDWENLGASLASAPAVAATGIDQMAVFARDPGGRLYRNSWNGGAWSGFVIAAEGSWPTISSATVQPDTLTIDLFTQGPDGALWHATAPVVT